MRSAMERTEKCFWTLEMCGLSVVEALRFHWYGGGRSQRAAVREERFLFQRWKYWYGDDLPISSIKKKEDRSCLGVRVQFQNWAFFFFFLISSLICIHYFKKTFQKDWTFSFCALCYLIIITFLWIRGCIRRVRDRKITSYLLRVKELGFTPLSLRASNYSAQPYPRKQGCVQNRECLPNKKDSPSKELKVRGIVVVLR